MHLDLPWPKWPRWKWPVEDQNWDGPFPTGGGAGPDGPWGTQGPTKIVRGCDFIWEHPFLEEDEWYVFTASYDGVNNEVRAVRLEYDRENVELVWTWTKDETVVTISIKVTSIGSGAASPTLVSIFVDMESRQEIRSPGQPAWPPLVNQEPRESENYGVSGTNSWGCVSTAEAQGGCDCGGSISYTSRQMETSTNQALSVASPGSDGDSCYTWNITSGGGSFASGSSVTETTGLSVTYYSPASNANCANNPTITLSCGGAVIDTLTLAINDGESCNTSGYYAYAECVGFCYSDGTDYHCCYNTWRCDGSLNPTTGGCTAEYGSHCTSSKCGAQGVTLEGYEPTYNLTSRANAWSTCTCGGNVSATLDGRDATALSNGCCPWQAL